MAELGRGGFGVVYQARHQQTKRLVALKLLREGLDDAKLLERFRAEADALAKLQHPNIVRLLEAGQHEGRPYFVMELITGGGLDDDLASKPRTARQAAEQMEVIARAVEEAHRAGIVHRDLKPGNVLVMADGLLKVTDFGLAKRLDVDLRQTSTGVLLGTPAYMSPEQATGQAKAIGPATDVWALGVILYEMLTGRLPFAGDNVLQMLERICGADPAPPGSLKADVPRDLETICLKCLHKRPERRYGGAGGLADDLKRYREDRPILARRVGLRERLVKWRRRHPVAAALALVMLLALLGGAAGWGWHWDRYLRLKAEYYANVVNHRGVKEGVGRLSAKEASRCEKTYKIYRRAGLVERVDVVNGRGEFVTSGASVAELSRGSQDDDRSNPECRFDYTRNGKGELLEERATDRRGNVLWVLHYTTPTTAHYTNAEDVPQAPDKRKAKASPEAGLPQARTQSGAVYLRLEWTEEGWPGRVLYLDGAGKPHPDDGGVYGVSTEHDPWGLPVSRTYLDAAGRPALHRTRKVATITYRYDERGTAVEGRNFGADGRPCLDRDGVHCWTTRLDECGNEVEGANYGTGDEPCLHKDGYHHWTSAYDEQGNRVEWAYFNIDGDPCLHKDGHHRSVAKHDERGNTVEVACFGTDGRPCLGT
jgi:hypothetical protein